MGANGPKSSRATRRGLASFVAFLLLFAFALGQGSSLMALAGGDSTYPVAAGDAGSEGVSRVSALPVPEAPAEEAAAGEGSGDAADPSGGTTPVTGSTPTGGNLKTAGATGESVDATPAAPPAAGLDGGDISLDFVAAGPFTYNHATGLGSPPQFGYDNRTISKTNGVVESLEGGDFECGDLVTFFVQVAVAGDAAGSGAVELDMSFGNETTGQPGIGFDNIVSVAINTPDGGNVGLDGTETATLSNEHLDTAGYDEVKGTVTVSGLDAGETAIVRIIVHLACELNATPTGNILNAIDAARVVGDGTVNVGQETVPMKQVGGLQAEPGIDVFKDCPATAPAGDAVTYEITVTNTGNVDLSGITVVDDIIGDLSSQFPDTLPVGSDPVTVQVEYTPVPGDGDPVTNTVTATGNWDAGETSESVSDTAECTTDITHAPGIDVTKTCPASVAFGADISYTITITNTGNEALENLLVSDALLGGDITAVFNVPDPFPIGGVASAEFTYTPGADEDPVVNSVTASGDGVDSGVEASDTASCSTDVSNPGISILKTVDEEVVPIGTTVTFTYVVTNTGDVTLYNIVVDDDILGLIGTIAQLDPGDDATLTKDFVVGDEIVTNVGTATGHDILGREVSASDDATVAPISGENPPPPKTPPTPFTGSDAGRLGLVAMALFGIGVTVVASTRRRRPKGEAA
jgi:uncharacterized repeat protein (TIGR01451 family)